MPCQIIVHSRHSLIRRFQTEMHTKTWRIWKHWLPRNCCSQNWVRQCLGFSSPGAVFSFCRNMRLPSKHPVRAAFSALLSLQYEILDSNLDQEGNCVFWINVMTPSNFTDGFSPTVYPRLSLWQEPRIHSEGDKASYPWGLAPMWAAN